MEVAPDDVPFQDVFKAHRTRNFKYTPYYYFPDSIIILTLLVPTQGPIEMDFWNGDEIAPAFETEGPVIGELFLILISCHSKLISFHRTR